MGGLLAVLLLLCLAATTQFAQMASATKATSLKLRTNPKADLRLTKRDYITTTFRPNNETVFGFFVDVLVGTPPQFFSLAFSTSPTTWLPSPINTTVEDFCEENGTGSSFYSCFYDNFFQPNKSSTFKKRNGTLDNSYGEGLFATGTWGSDVFKINQLTVQTAYFGLASNFTNSAELGLGVDLARRYSPYPSLPEVMAGEGAINLILYSVYVNDIRNDGGEIFFGAIDDAKYQETLVTYDSTTVGQVPINGVYFVAPDGTNTSLLDAALTTPEIGEIQLGTPSLWVPNDVYSNMLNMIPSLTYATAYDAYIVDCAIDDSELGTVQFDIKGQIISINARQILVEYPTGSGNCVFTVYQTGGSSTSTAYLLGTPFLRSAFTVFDYTNNQTSIAQSVANSTSSTLREVPESGVEGLAQVSGLAVPTNTATSTLPSYTATVSSSSDATASTKSTPVAAIAGGSVGGAIALAIAGVIAWWVVSKKKPKEPDMPEPPEQMTVDTYADNPYGGAQGAARNDTGYVPETPVSAIAPSFTSYGNNGPVLYGNNGTVELGNQQQGYQYPYQQHSYGVQPDTQTQAAPVNAPPTSYHENWGTAQAHTSYNQAGYTSNGRPASGSTIGSAGLIGTDLSSYGGQPGNQGGMPPSPGLNAQGVYGNYGYSGYNQY